MSVIFNPAAVAGGSGITQLTGDVTAGPGTGSQVATLATVNANVGTWGDATHVGQFTVNAKGLITAASNVAISGGGGGMTIGGAVVGGTLGSILFINPGGILAQDNANFFWDEVHDSLVIQGRNAVFRVPNVGGDNWFESGAGNFTVTGAANLGTGNSALANVTTGANNVGIGTNALAALTIGSGNFAVGTNALAGNIDGINNTAIGIQALYFLNSAGGGNGNNVALGFRAGFNCAGANNLCIGFQAGLIGTNINNNAFIGYDAGSSFTSGNSNVCIGTNALAGSGTGNQNCVIGTSAGINITSGSWATLIGGWQGPSAGVSRVIGVSDGTAANLNLDFNYTKAQTWSFNYDQYWTAPVGIHVYNVQDASPPTNYERGVFDWNITSNVLTIGTPTSSAGGTGVLRETRLYTKGLPAVFTVTNASGNNWFEGNAGNFGTSGNANLGTGDGVLASLTSGSRNIAVGSTDAFYGGTGGSLTTGSDNTIFGVSALALCVSGSQNFALGSQSLRQATGSNNTAIGFHALNQCTTQENNVAIGTSAGENLSTGGGGNVCIGYAAGIKLTTGDSNVIIQPNQSSLGPAGGATRNIVIGSLAGGGTFSGIFGAGFDNILMGYAAGFNLQGGSSSNVIIGEWQGPAATINNVIALSYDTTLKLDYNYIAANIWSINNLTTAQGLHIYKTLDSANSPTNWERAALSWRDTSNTFRIESQAGGTGTIRIIAIDGFSKAGAPAAGDLPSGTWALIDDTSGNQTWLVFNKAGTIRKVQLV